MNERYKKLVSNTMIFTVGKFVSKLIVIFMLPFYTSYLSSAEYSTADLITNLCNLLIPIACLGVSEGIFRGAASKNEDKEAFFTNGVLLMIFGSLGFLVLSPLVKLIGYFDGYVWLIVLYVLSSNIHSVCSQYVCAIGRTKLFSGQGVLNTVLTVLLNILFLVGFDMGIEGYVLSVVLADFLSALFLFFVAKLYRAFKPEKIDKRIMRELLRFCLPLVPSTVFWWITGVSDRYMVAAIASDEINGLYAAAYKIPTLLTYVVIIFNDAWKLSAISESDDKGKLSLFFSNVFKNYIAIMFSGGAVIALGAQLLSKILFAKSYEAAWIYIPILAVATVFSAFDTFLGSAYFTVKKTGMSFKTAMLGAITNIVLNLILIPPYGAMGASVATLISYFLVFVVRTATMRKYLAFNLYPIRLAVNTAAVTAIAIIMTLYGNGVVGFAISAVATVLLTIYNFKDILSAIHNLISSRKNRRAD